MTEKETQKMASVIRGFFKAKGITPPITAEALRAKGYDPVEFLNEFAETLKPWSNEPITKNFLDSCKDLI